ncbi:dihydroorotate dehydrogenase [Romboutsia sp.]|uniref:dihydroorotate dehydrogenase n=1 Tax=Romboutsia sp. TaxID=1965302 RepID=UPI002BBDA8EE|nr:dihydroorotate dehydrogenase [Romboutsia sp.]HSQ87349.1 dihydroorotate dehydrogenase [Romboutsia sp.]
MADLGVKFGNIDFKNPLVMASGTFGFGKEYNEIYDIQKLGGVSSKGLTLNKRDGNIGMRVCETPSGMMNSVGLENPGVQGFIDNELQFFKDLDLVRIANVGGGTLEDYLQGVQLLNDQPIDMIELNISCPNVKAGGMAFGIKNEVAREVVREVRNVTNLPLVIKLSPNAEDIIGMAKVCEEEGADGVSLVNTFKAMAIDIHKRKPVFENIYAGLSGPAIKPIALRMVHEVCKNVNIPVMGMGGITTAQDAIEFIMAGSTCIQVGTANFINPKIGLEIIDEIEEFMIKEGIKNLNEIRGIL